MLSDKSLFEYCQARRYFSLVLPYTNSGDLLLIPDLFTNHLTWKMHGGSVKSAESEDFVRAAERHVRSSVPDISLGEVEPVALLENTFIYRGEIHTHSGIAFIGRIRNHHHPNVREALRSNPGRLVSYIDHTPKVEHSYHSEVLQCALPKIDLARRLTSQENEVEANERNIPRFELHNRIGKPLFRFFSYFFGETSIPSFERLTIEKALSKSASVDIDVGCGENSKLINASVSANVPLVVGTDISWSHIRLMKERTWVKSLRDSNSLLLFTNHDARRLPFKDFAFDTAVCKNVLHHMPDAEFGEALSGRATTNSEAYCHHRNNGPQSRGMVGPT